MKQIKKITVLGIGNRLMEDDGVGNYVVDELKSRGAFSELRLSAGETDTEYCLSEIGDAEKIILIDAALTGAQPGTISVYRLDRGLLPEMPGPVQHHNFNLLYAMRANCCEKEGILIAIEASAVGFRPGLSNELQKKFSKIVDKVYREIENYLLA